MSVPAESLLRELDVTPSSPEALARRLGTDLAVVEQGLAAAERERLAVCWGDVWATTWRAKLALHPNFFRTWVPLSAAAGCSVTALTVTLYGGDAGRGWVAPLVLVAGAMALAALLTLVRRKGRKVGKSG